MLCDKAAVLLFALPSYLHEFISGFVRPRPAGLANPARSGIDWSYHLPATSPPALSAIAAPPIRLTIKCRIVREQICSFESDRVLTSRIEIDTDNGESSSSSSARAQKIVIAAFSTFAPPRHRTLTSSSTSTNVHSFSSAPQPYTLKQLRISHRASNRLVETIETHRFGAASSRTSPRVQRTRSEPRHLPTYQDIPLLD